MKALSNTPRGPHRRGRTWIGSCLGSAALLLALIALPSLAPPSYGADQPLTLKDCISRALADAPELGEAQADIELVQGKLAEAKGYRLPQIDFLGLIGPVPKVRGNQVYSPDSINTTDRWTWFQRGDVLLVQPIYGFGRISHSMAAAEHGIEVEKSRKEQKRNEIVLKVKEYYYGVLLAREMKSLLGEVRDDLSKARDKAQKLLDQNSVNVEEADIFKLDAFTGEVQKYLAEANKGESLALTALKTRMQLPPDAKVEVADARLVKVEEPIADVSTYVARAKELRPEFKQVSEGLQARKDLVAAAKAERYPVFFLGGMLSGAHAEGRDRVHNPYVPDEFNHFWAGAALGMRWKLDFGITSAKIAQEQAQYDKLISTKSFADENIPLQIQKFHDEGVEAAAGIEATQGGYQSAKKWAVTAIANFDFGVGPGKDIFDSLQQYAKMRAAYFQSIYNYNLAVANLHYAVGEAPM